MREHTKIKFDEADNETETKHFDRGSYRAVHMDNGWMQAYATLTRPGVMLYRNADGTERREFRPPEEVFDKESMASLALKPVTLLHPGKNKDELLDGANTRKYQRGMTGENIKRDGDFVGANLMLTDDEAVQAAKTGAAGEASCSYMSRDSFEPGVYQGQPYDIVQRHIRYNHVALVPMGRAGHDARIHMDAAEGEYLGPIQVNATVTNTKNDTQEHTVKTKINGIEFDINDTAAQALALQTSAHEAEVKTLKGAVDVLQAKFDAAEKTATELKTELARAEDPATQRAAIQARASLEAAAGPVLGVETKMDAMSDSDVKKAYLAKRGVKFDGKSEEYIAAAYDIESTKSKTTEAQTTPSPADARRVEIKNDAAAVGLTMAERHANDWQKPIGVHN